MRIRLLLATLLLFNVSDYAHSQSCTPTLEEELGGIPINNGKNYGQVRFDSAEFPDTETDPSTGQSISGLQSAMEDAVRLGMENWNDACRGTIANHYPTLIPNHGGSFPASFDINIIYNPGRNPNVNECPWDRSADCASPAKTDSFEGGRIEIRIYRYYGDVTDLKRTFLTYGQKLDRLTTHELGHALGLEHNDCDRSYMDGSDALITDPSPRMIAPEECDLLQETYDPPDPLATLDNDERCSLIGYCPSDVPWPLQRTVCGWLSWDVPTTVFDGEVSITTTTRVQDYVCFPIGITPLEEDEGLPWPPPMLPRFHHGPRVLLAHPRPEQTLSDNLEIHGWAWEATEGIQEVAVFIDGHRHDAFDFSFNLYAPEACNTGIDVINCDPYSGFSGNFDISQLSPGGHTLQIVATNGRNPDPLPGHLTTTFLVGDSQPDGPPIAVTDDVTAIVHLGSGEGEPVIIPVTSNDHSPGGGPVRLKTHPIVLAPRHGTVLRWSDHEIVYTPTSPSAKSDIFKYEIVDEDGRVARGRVLVTFLLAFP